MKHNLDPHPLVPARAVITAGMPYGNKKLHFGHVGGVFVQADFYARYLRSRIGAENVIFVSGTDGYGSPILEGYRKLKENDDPQSSQINDINEFVALHHVDQLETLHEFQVAPDLYGASSLTPAAPVHEALSHKLINELIERDVLHPHTSLQFYDATAQMFLNGRQVVGRCPVQGCKSEKAYADECDMGHQFEPSELIAPKSAITGETPELKEVINWYFDLPDYKASLEQEIERLKADPQSRAIVSQTAQDFLGDPIIYVKNECEEAYRACLNKLPDHEFAPAEKGKASFSLTFKDYRDREQARDVLLQNSIKLRTSKTLVPFRITGNVSWGVSTPDRPDMEGLTVWCWPESLWAPISFTKTVLEDNATNAPRGEICQASNPTSKRDWRDWWCSDEAKVIQFIGQDNIYFYSVAQPALFEALDWGLKPTCVVANHHILYMNTKASSSGALKPPLARELLNHYSAEQLRCHWLSLGLEGKSVSFSPKVFDPEKRDEPRAADPVLKEGALLTNIFNRLARTCFYTAARQYDCSLSYEPVADEVIDRARKAITKYEDHVNRFEFHKAFMVCDEYLREANKVLSAACKEASLLAEDDERSGKKAYGTALARGFFELHVATILMYPAAPLGCKKIADAFGLDHERFLSFKTILAEMDELVEACGAHPAIHRVVELPPRYDFFEAHESQYANKK